MILLPSGTIKRNNTRDFSGNRVEGGNTLFQKVMFILLLMLCFTMLISDYALAQGGSSYYNPQDEKYVLLALKRAKDNYEFYKKELERVKELLKDGQKSQKDYDDIKKSYDNAEVDYQQQMLSVLFENQYIIISNAVKYSSETGDKVVRITLDNSSSGSAELKKLINFDKELFKALEPDVINNIYVSILNDNAIIGQPYERKIERLPANQPKDVSFVLLQDVDVVTVHLLYGRGSTIDKTIYLKKDSSINKVEIQSDQFSQEVELGNSATYDLRLELFSGTSDTFKLEVLNLPSQINRYFVSAGTDTRLSYFKFTESTSTKKASLKVFLPDRASDSIKMDKSIAFYALAIPQNRVKEINLDVSKHYTEKEITDLNVGYVKLDLKPRGVGELLVKAQLLFFSIDPGESVEVPIELVNNGTRSLNNVEIDIDYLPLNWTYTIDPKNIDRLNVSEEKRAIINIVPSSDAAPNRYEVRISTTSLSDEQPISGEDKTIIVEIKAKTNLVGMIIIIVLILGLVGGMVFFGIKLSRR